MWYIEVLLLLLWLWLVGFYFPWTGMHRTAALLCEIGQCRSFLHRFHCFLYEALVVFPFPVLIFPLFTVLSRSIKLYVMIWQHTNKIKMSMIVSWVGSSLIWTRLKQHQSISSCKQCPECVLLILSLSVETSWRIIDSFVSFRGLYGTF